jgi:hypothetical protein
VAYPASPAALLDQFTKQTGIKVSATVPPEGVALYRVTPLR